MFERGFKAWCERYAAQKRAALGLKEIDPLDPFGFAKHLGIRVLNPTDVPGLSQESLNVLLRNDGKTSSCWSAVTIIAGSKVAIVINSSHSAGRQSSDLMHELAHRIREHRAEEMEISESGVMMLKAYDKAQEEEADWLSGSLLLPRDALIWIKSRGIALPIAAEAFGVSVRMLNYRLAMTGVNRQFASA